MKQYDISRRTFMKTSIAGATVGALGMLGGQAGQAAEAEKRQINIAGYAYDRVRAIMDGQAGIQGADVSFDVQDIYKVSKFAFGPERKYEVTELGLIPFISKYINNNFRDYTLIPVFISAPTGIAIFSYMLIPELKSPKIYAAKKLGRQATG